jgi:hypothetical protein
MPSSSWAGEARQRKLLGAKLLADCTPLRGNMQSASNMWAASRYDSMFLLATMPLVRIAAVIGMWSAALVSLAW